MVCALELELRFATGVVAHFAYFDAKPKLAGCRVHAWLSGRHEQVGYSRSNFEPLEPEFGFGSGRRIMAQLTPRSSAILVGLIVLGLIVGLIVVSLTSVATDDLTQIILPSRVTLGDSQVRDQDDMCIWIHPTENSLSTIIASDKTAKKLFVYDLQGNTLQVLPFAGTPGNIDIRYNFELAGVLQDIVAINDRGDSTIQVFRVDHQTRHVARIDNGAITTLGNYGLCLYRSPTSGSFFAFTTAQDGQIGQYELRDEKGQVAGRLVRSWDIGSQTEGCVCDDETGLAFFGEEDVGIWKVSAEPSDPVAPASVAHADDASGLTADVEGLTIYYTANGGGYLIASSQGSNEFKVYERAPPHSFVETFTVAGVTGTDGVDVINMNLGSAFPSGIIAAHNDSPPFKTVEVCAYEDSGLQIDTEYWNPRSSHDAIGVDVPGAHQLAPGSVRP